MLPGEAMAEDISLSLSSDEESSSQLVKKPSPRPAMNLQTDVTPNSIRLDALKLSKQLKCKIQSISDDSVTNIELKVRRWSFRWRKRLQGYTSTVAGPRSQLGLIKCPKRHFMAYKSNKI